MDSNVNGSCAYLVSMRSSDEDYRTPPWYFPRSSRMHLAEEQVDQDGEGPEEYIVYPIRHVRVFLLRVVGYVLVDL